MNDRSAFPIHADLLAQVATSEAEEREVRRILAPLTDAELSARNTARLGDVESAIAAYKRAPWPYAPANHAHRHSRPACSRCESGAAQCLTPEACERADDPRPAPRAGGRARVWALFLSPWGVGAAIVFALVALGVSL